MSEMFLIPSLNWFLSVIHHHLHSQPHAITLKDKHRRQSSSIGESKCICGRNGMMTHSCFIAVQAKIKMFFPLSIAMYDNIHISALDTWTDTSLSAVELCEYNMYSTTDEHKLFRYMSYIICCWRDVECSMFKHGYFIFAAVFNVKMSGVVFKYVKRKMDKWPNSLFAVALFNIWRIYGFSKRLMEHSSFGILYV